METTEDDLLSVPITDAERSRARSDSQRHLLEESLKVQQHRRDSEFNSTLGRFKSLRTPEQRQQSRFAGQAAATTFYDPQSSSSGAESRDVEIRPAEPEHATSIAFTQTTHLPQQEVAYLSLESPPRLWLSPWLRRTTLALLILFFLSGLVALLVLKHFSDEYQGFRLASSATPYAWTYGPTAVMVVAVALWRQVDHHCKMLTPWEQLKNGPTKPSHSILVDYISPFQITSLCAAFKRGHIPVIVTILAFFLTKLSTIASTGLFYVRPATFIETDHTTTASRSPVTSDLNSLLTANSSVLPAMSVYAYYSHRVRDLPLVTGVTDELAFVPQVLDFSPQLTSGTNYSYLTQAFVPRIDCEVVTVGIVGGATIKPTNIRYNSTAKPYGTNGDLSLTFPSNHICDQWPNITVPAIDPLHYKAPSRRVQGTSHRVSCASNNSRTASTNEEDILIYTMTNISYTQTVLTNTTRPEGGRLPIALNTSRTVNQMVNLVCKPSYAMISVNVTNTTTTSGSRTFAIDRLDSSNRTLTGLSTTNITSLFRVLSAAARGLFDMHATFSDELHPTTPFNLLAVAAGVGPNNYSALFDGSTLHAAATGLYTGVMLQFASRNLLTLPAAQTSAPSATAIVTLSRDRLFVNKGPCYFMVASFGLLATASLVLYFLAPRLVVPRDPRSIAPSATILSRSVELNRVLRKQQIPNDQNLPALLDGYEVGTAIATSVDGHSSFKVVVTSGTSELQPDRLQNGIRWWSPFTSSLPFLIFVTLVSLALVILLGLLQRRSDEKQGLLSVPADEASLYASRYLPTLIMLLVASLFNNLDFNIALFAPWAALARGDSAGTQSILASVSGRSPLSSILHAFRSRKAGVLASTFAVLSASLLSVFVSGLFSTAVRSFPGPTRAVNRLDSWRFDADYSVIDDGGSGAVLNILEHSVSEYPDLTWDEFAFPNTSFGALNAAPGTHSRLNGTTTASIPALRGHLSCDVIDESDLNLSTVVYGSANQSTVSRVNVIYTLPTSCRLGGSGNGNNLSIEVDFAPKAGASEFGGRLLDLRFGTNSSVYGHYGESDARSVADNPAVGCPSVALVFGEFSLDRPDVGLVTAAICYQEVQQVTTQVTFQENSTALSHAFPPVADESTIQTLENPRSSIGAQSFDFRIQENLRRQLGSFDGTNSSTGTSTNTNIDPFFQAVINGSQSNRPESLVGQAHVQTALSATNHLYRRYMAQVYNSLMRDRSDAASVLRPRQNGLGELQTTVSTARLTQNKASTIVLQILLIVAALFISTGFGLTKMRHVLPCNPCSIAGTMSLLAGSDLCWTPEDGVCECCGKQRRNSFGAESRAESIQAGAEADDENENENENELGDHDGSSSERRQFIVDGTDWMDDRDFDRMFDRYQYSLGWWREDAAKGRRRRFGVDTGSRPDDDEVGDWTLGRRKNQGTMFGAPADRGRGLMASDTRGQYARADASPGDLDSHEMRSMAGVRRQGRDGLYGDG